MVMCGIDDRWSATGELADRTDEEKSHDNGDEDRLVQEANNLVH
jgi:hypothetical protein